MLAILIDPINLRVTEQYVEYKGINALLNCDKFKLVYSFNMSADAQQMDVLCVNSKGSSEPGCKGFEFTTAENKKLNVAQRALVCRVDLAQNGKFISPQESLYNVALMVDWLPKERPVFNSSYMKIAMTETRSTGATII